MKKHVLLLSIFILLLWQVTAQAQIITTVAGGGTTGLGDGGAATDCQLDNPTGVAIDATGNLYIADRSNNRIRKINAMGIVTTIAGTGTAGYTGDNGPATLATLNRPYGIALSTTGEVFFSEVNNQCIRKINSSGIISTIAGTGIAGYNGDNMPATNAQLSGAGCIAIDNLGNIYIPDFDNHRLRKVAVSGEITTVAGIGVPGYSGDDGAATAAKMNAPQGVTLDGGGNIYVSEYQNNCIRKIDVNGKITTIAGGAIGYSGDGGPATAAKLRRPVGVAINASGYLYFSDGFNHCIREINPSGIINTIAGTGVNGFSGDGASATTAKLFGPAGVTVDAANNIYIADWGNNRIRTLNLPTSTVNDPRLTVPSLLVYPNPNNGQFRILITAYAREPIQMAFCDIIGRKLMEFIGTTNETFVVPDDIPTGVYMLAANLNGVPISQKISIIR